MKIPATTEGDRIFIGPKNTSFGRRVELVNPTDRSFTRHRFVLEFGAYGTTRLMVWADSLCDAVETAAEHLAKWAPGHIMPAWGEAHVALVKEACEEAGHSYPEGFEALEDEEKWEICASAEADLTLTESGFLTSHEWALGMEDPTRADLDRYLYPPSIDWKKERAWPPSRIRC